MPNRDKTGPEGKGPNTGRGAGNCDNNPAGSQQEQFDRMMGTTDFAKDQYGGTRFPINQDNYKYPERSDSGGTEFYGKRWRKGQK